MYKGLDHSSRAKRELPPLNSQRTAVHPNRAAHPLDLSHPKCRNWLVGSITFHSRVGVRLAVEGVEGAGPVTSPEVGYHIPSISAEPDKYNGR